MVIVGITAYYEIRDGPPRRYGVSVSNFLSKQIAVSYKRGNGVVCKDNSLIKPLSLSAIEIAFS